MLRPTGSLRYHGRINGTIIAARVTKSADDAQMRDPGREDDDVAMHTASAQRTME